MQLMDATQQPSRLKSVEFLVYYVQIAFAYAYMTYMTVGMSNEYITTHYAYGLQPGWILNRMMDATDHQWNAYRHYFPILMLGNAAYVLLSRWARSKLSPRGHLAVLAAVNLLVVIFVHRSTAPFALLVVLANYAIGQAFRGSKLNLLFTWVFGAAYMVYNERVGFSFGALAPSLAWLDAWRPLYRWGQCINLAMLRMISHNTDLYWSVTGGGGDATPPPERFSLAAYLAYVFYFPLYLTGPTISFGSFVGFAYAPQRALSTRQVLVYGLRVGGAMLLLEVMLHFFYVVAISKYTGSWEHHLPGEIGSVSYWILMFLWLKFFIMWRFARFWALLDGVDPPENMTRCVNNNYTMSGFWRGWHRSFNRWLVRYVYVPLGGNKTRVYNIWVVFTFVALWHDMTMQLLAWSWLICIFLLIEFGGAFIARKLRLHKLPYYRWIRGAAAAFNILLMMIANLVGFSVGPNGIQTLLRLVMQPSGMLFVLGMFTTFFAAAQIMFELERFRQTKD